jgi:hypothetical protein
MQGIRSSSFSQLNSVINNPRFENPAGPADKPLSRPQDGMDPIVASGPAIWGSALAVYLTGEIVKTVVNGAVGDQMKQTGKNVATLMTSDKGPPPPAGTKQPTDGASGNSGSGAGGASGNSGAGGSSGSNAGGAQGTGG